MMVNQKEVRKIACLSTCLFFSMPRSSLIHSSFKQHLSDFMKNHLCYTGFCSDKPLFICHSVSIFLECFFFFRLNIPLPLKSLVYNFGGKQTKRTGTKTGRRSQTIWMRFGSCLSNLPRRVQSPSVVPTVQILINISCYSITGCFLTI